MRRRIRVTALVIVAAISALAPLRSSDASVALVSSMQQPELFAIRPQLTSRQLTSPGNATVVTPNATTPAPAPPASMIATVAGKANTFNVVIPIAPKDNPHDEEPWREFPPWDGYYNNLAEPKLVSLALCRRTFW